MKRICPLHGYWIKKDKDDRCPKCSKGKNKNYDRTKRDQSSKKIYNSKKWIKESRPGAIVRDNGRCVKCGSNENLVVDHIKELKDGGSPYDLNNLQTLCKKCHKIKTDIEKKRRNAK